MQDNLWGARWELMLPHIVKQNSPHNCWDWLCCNNRWLCAHPRCGMSVMGQYKQMYHSCKGDVLAIPYWYTSGKEIFCYKRLPLLWQKEETLSSSSNPQSEHNSGKWLEILLSSYLKNIYLYQQIHCQRYLYAQRLLPSELLPNWTAV
jgi:hypothetical protein